MLGKELVNFIKSNKLEEVEIQTLWDDSLVWSIYLDSDHEIEYSFNYDGEHTIKELIYPEDDDFEIDETIITAEQALQMRGLAD